MGTATRHFDLIREMRDAYNPSSALGAVGPPDWHQADRTSVRHHSPPLCPRSANGCVAFSSKVPVGLLEQYSAPHYQPRKTGVEIEQQVVGLRQQLPTFGGRRLIRDFELPLSHRALQRIRPAHGDWCVSAAENYQRKQDRPTSKRSGLCSSRSAPIPRIWTIFRTTGPRLGSSACPSFSTRLGKRRGLLFWAFAQRRSAAASAVFAARIYQHLDRYGISLRDLVWQTDNGSEFIGGHDSAGKANAGYRCGG